VKSILTSTLTVVASICPVPGEDPIATNGGQQTALSRLHTNGALWEAHGELVGRIQGVKRRVACIPTRRVTYPTASWLTFTKPPPKLLLYHNVPTTTPFSGFKRGSITDCASSSPTRCNALSTTRCSYIQCPSKNNKPLMRWRTLTVSYRPGIGGSC
jgi:hypothetical protein